MKETQKLLTVAIPTYNMEPYLPRCLDSLIQDHETAKLIEVLVVNDGSNDRSLSIAQDYASRTSCISVVDKPNGGWGSAVNLAIKQAKGKYFKILDADDDFDPQAFTLFVGQLKTATADIVATSTADVYDDQPTKITQYPPELCGRVHDLNDYLRETGYQGGIPMACMSVKTALLQRNHFEVCERYYADIDYLLNVLFYAQTVAFSRAVVYRYYHGREGQSTNAMGYARHIDDFLRLSIRLATSYEAHKYTTTDEIKRTYLKNSVASIQFAYQLLMSPSFNISIADAEKKLREFDAKLKATSKYIYKAVGKVRRRGIPFILIWRLFRINLFSFR